MPNRINILNELKELGSILASLPPVHAYQAPAGYFEDFPASMLGAVTATGLISPQLQQARTNPYQVPQGYFEGLAASLLARVKASDATADEEIALLSPLLSSLDKKLPFSTPEGYFSDLTHNTVAGAMTIESDSEEENLSPLMSTLRHQQVYEVPADYFEQLPSLVMEDINRRQPAKVIPFHFAKRVIRYAAAAMVAGVIATGGWFYLHKTDKAILAAASTPSIPANISVEALQLYLEGQNTAAPDPNYINTAMADIKEVDMKEMLADISDAELQHYAEQNNLNPPTLNN